MADQDNREREREAMQHESLSDMLKAFDSIKNSMNSMLHRAMSAIGEDNEKEVIRDLTHWAQSAEGALRTGLTELTPGKEDMANANRVFATTMRRVDVALQALGDANPCGDVATDNMIEEARTCAELLESDWQDLQDGSEYTDRSDVTEMFTELVIQFLEENQELSTRIRTTMATCLAAYDATIREGN